MFATKGRQSFSSTSARKADITLTVDGKEVSVPQGATSVQQNMPTPTFGSSCRLCIDPSM
jgi:NADH dehydrogenase (ubiquinone) Fe-S protein 1